MSKIIFVPFSFKEISEQKKETLQVKIMQNKSQTKIILFSKQNWHVFFLQKF